MESGILFISSSDNIGIFTKIFCRYSYIGVYLRHDNYSITIINPFLLVEPRTYHLNHIKELYEVSTERINSIYIKKCNLTSSYENELGFEGFLTKKDDFPTVISSLLSNDQIGIEAINDLFTRLYPNFKFNCHSIEEYEKRDDIFCLKVEIMNFYPDKKDIPLSIVHNIGRNFNLRHKIKQGFDSIDLMADIKHIKIDTLLDTLNHFNKVFLQEKYEQKSLAGGSHPAVLTVGSRDKNLAIEFNDSSEYILTSNMTMLGNLTREHKLEILQYLDIQSDGSHYFENIRRHIHNSL
uniref:Uncharacterized protein n=1 Tax=Pithovirus LCPAC401 TaxID=2506595 RepID=A0A481ZCB9_9VIRU|nr:MAG: uncharacterized protein LCPAC401_03470 [Pithovirus LCPAC401]